MNIAYMRADGLSVAVAQNSFSDESEDIAHGYPLAPADRVYGKSWVAATVLRGFLLGFIPDRVNYVWRRNDMRA
ncbi:hypothetical protein [Streptomyces arenae]|uniref:hypothetical protein n=1 Tax=Streptomyces arenae TaxID=29301 RepID=UPI0026594D30|nr:hypothetical protein [Streptomyces arenae]MCG7204072.1 hypothetical protein [Streptomyces arenae]